MTFLSINPIPTNRTLINPSNLLPPRNPRIFPTTTTSPLLIPNPTSRNRITISSAAAKTAVGLQQIKTLQSLPEWEEFAARASGEWDGFAADFTAEGNPVELPESVVPQAFREWEVRVFDWQTQCPTLAIQTGEPKISYKMIKLLPTVGCEADAATRHSVDERIAGGEGNAASAFGYHPTGCYIGVWPTEDRSGRNFLEIEHCLVGPGNHEARVRVIQDVRLDAGVVKLERITVFSEQWYGPFRNGEQLGGCAIRESGFASNAAVKESKVIGIWQETSISVASFGVTDDTMDIFRELQPSKPQKRIRDKVGLVTLPKDLWCSVKETDGEIWAEVGLLVDRGVAMTSRCVFMKDGRLKEMAVVKETLDPDGM